MKIKPRAFLLVGIGALLAASGCTKEDGIDTTELERAFSAEAAQAAPADAGQPPSQGSQVQQTVDRALTALKNNDYEESSVALTALRANPTLNADQLTAVQDAMAELQLELARRADRGDARAKQALELIGQMQRNR